MMSEHTPNAGHLSVAHSSCPRKRDIQPPNFRVTETMHLSKEGSLVTMECEGCRTRIVLTVPWPDPPVQETP